MPDTETRDEILNMVRRTWDKYPELRLGQLIFNASGEGGNVFYMPDDKLMTGLRGLFNVR